MKFTPLFNIFCRDVERQMRGALRGAGEPRAPVVRIHRVADVLHPRERDHESVAPRPAGAALRRRRTIGDSPGLKGWRVIVRSCVILDGCEVARLQGYRVVFQTRMYGVS